MGVVVNKGKGSYSGRALEYIRAVDMRRSSDPTVVQRLN